MQMSTKEGCLRAPVSEVSTQVQGQGVLEPIWDAGQTFKVLPHMQMSTGEGKAKVLDEKETTVYKRALDQEYKLKLKASRQIFSEINKKYPTMPFTVRALDSKQSRLGLVECLNHGLLHPYPVLHEKVSHCF